MPNPILIFLDLDKFGLPIGWRGGVKSDGAIEAIGAGTQYSLVLLGDRDQFGELSFHHNREEATLGVEHRSWPISDAHRTRLMEICGHYECVHTFSHIENNDIFEYVQEFFLATDNVQRLNTVDKIISLIKSLDQWNGFVQFLMNKQIRILGGGELNINALPRSAWSFNDRQGEGDNYTKIIEDFLSSSSPA
jgi:hypothetical protein